MADATRGARPLSPHLQIFRRYNTMVVSILHRITGFAMALSMALVVWWFVALASSPEYYAFVGGILTSWIGILIWLASLLGLSLHLLNGIRHLIWDTGSYLGAKSATRSAWYVLIGAPVLTVVVLLIVWLR